MIWYIVHLFPTTFRPLAAESCKQSKTRGIWEWMDMWTKRTDWKQIPIIELNPLALLWFCVCLFVFSLTKSISFDCFWVCTFSLSQVSFYFYRPHISGGGSFDLDVKGISVTVIAKLGWWSIKIIAIKVEGCARR